MIIIGNHEKWHKNGFKIRSRAGNEGESKTVDPTDESLQSLMTFKWAEERVSEQDYYLRKSPEHWHRIVLPPLGHMFVAGHMKIERVLSRPPNAEIITQLMFTKPKIEVFKSVIMQLVQLQL